MAYKIRSGLSQEIAVAQSVSAINITGGGAGYTSAPTVSIGAPPSGVTATATAVITGGVVTAINVTNPGSGYTSAPAVTLTGGGFTTAATATSSIASTSVASSAFDAQTFAVRIIATGNCHIEVGPAPTATASSAYVPSSTWPEYMRVSPGDKIAVIQDGAATGNLYITELSK